MAAVQAAPDLLSSSNSSHGAAPAHEDYDDVIYVQEDSEDPSDDEDEEDDEGEEDGEDQELGGGGDCSEDEDEDGFEEELRRSREAFFNHASITRSFLAKRKSVKVGGNH